MCVLKKTWGARVCVCVRMYDTPLGVPGCVHVHMYGTPLGVPVCVCVCARVCMPSVRESHTLMGENVANDHLFLHM